MGVSLSKTNKIFVNIFIIINFLAKRFSRRKHFVWIGNHTHAPNSDSLRVLINNIWPKIR